MDQLPKICPNCSQPNFPIAEFCRHCGEPIINLGSISKRNLFSRFISFIIDGIFWIIDEFIRWLEYAKVYLTLKDLRRKRANLLKLAEQNNNEQISIKESEHLVALSEEIAKLAKREEELRRQTWALFPEVVFILVLSITTLLYFWLRTPTNLATIRDFNFSPKIDLDGDIKYEFSIPLKNFTVIKSAVFYNNKIYIGGDGGLIAYNPNTKEVIPIPGLPENYFVRHITPYLNKLLIAGYGGIYSLENDKLTELYSNKIEGSDLYNFILPTKDGGHLIGTLGYGLLKGNNGLLSLVLGTQGISVVGAVWLDNELWILHEYGILKGSGLRFNPYNLYVLIGKKFNKIEVEDNLIYILADDSLIIGTKAYQNWVWTPISFADFKGVKDIYVSNKIALLATENGLFKYKTGKITKLASLPDLMAIGVTNNQIAAISPNNIHIFSVKYNISSSQISSNYILPSIGTYTNITANSNSQDALTSKNAMENLQSNNNTTPIYQQETRSLNINPISQPQQTNNNNIYYSQSNIHPDSSITFNTFPKELIQSKFLTSIINYKNFLLISTSNNGLWIYDKTRWNNLNSSNSNLKDNQITKILNFSNRVFITSPALGFYELVNNNFTQLLDSNELINIKSYYVDSQDKLWLLYNDGTVKSINIKDKKTLFESKILESFIKSSHSIYVDNNIPIVICNEGIIYNQANKWVANFYPKLDAQAIVKATTLSPENRIYIALSNNNIYVLEGRRISFLSTIPEVPKKLIYKQTLWAISDKNIYRFDATRFSKLDYNYNETIKDFELLLDNKQIVLITTNGIRFIQLL